MGAHIILLVGPYHPSISSSHVPFYQSYDVGSHTVLQILHSLEDSYKTETSLDHVSSCQTLNTQQCKIAFSARSCCSSVIAATMSKYYVYVLYSMVMCSVYIVFI